MQWISFNSLRDIRKAQENHLEAKAYYKKGLELSGALAQEVKTAKAYNNLGGSYYKCAMVNNPPDVVLLKQAYLLYDALAKQCPDVQEYAQYCNGILNIIRQYS